MFNVAGAVQGPLFRGVELRVRVCDPQLHQHLAEPDRGRARVPDDAGQRADGERRHRDRLLRRRPDGEHQQGPAALRVITTWSVST